MPHFPVNDYGYRQRTWKTMTSSQRREAIKWRLRCPHHGWHLDPAKDPLRSRP